MQNILITGSGLISGESSLTTKQEKVLGDVIIGHGENARLQATIDNFAKEGKTVIVLKEKTKEALIEAIKNAPANSVLIIEDVNNLVNGINTIKEIYGKPKLPTSTFMLKNTRMDTPFDFYEKEKKPHLNKPFYENLKHKKHNKRR